MIFRPSILSFLIVLVALVFSPALFGAEPGSRTPEELNAEVMMLEERVRALESVVMELRREIQAGREQARASTPVNASAVSEAPADSISVTNQVTASTAGSPARAAGPADLNASWNEGLRFQSSDRAFVFKVGGRLMNDWMWGSGPGLFLPVRDGTEFRRARINIEGELLGRLEYRGEYDFAGLTPDFKDVYIGITDIPGVGGIRVGHQKEPFSLEELVSSRHTTFMERALPNAFAPSRNTGVLLHNSILNERATVAAGVFRSSLANAIAVGDNGYNFSARFTGLPWYEDGGRKLVHLGAAYSHQNTILDSAIFASRPEAHLAPRFLTTGLLASNSYDLLGLEGATVTGPLSVQGEYVRAFVDSPELSDPNFQGAYVQASFFTTGEHRPYRKSNGTFDRLRPSSGFLEEGPGFGAWEVAVRYSWLDLNDKQVTGGELRDVTIGLNWYMNPNMKLMWNYVFADLVSSENGNIFQTRLQVDF